MKKVFDFVYHNFMAKSVLLIVITAISYGFLINNLNLWSDELYSVLMAKDSFSDMFELLTTEDSKPPLYYVYLKAVLALFPQKYEIFGAHFGSYLTLLFAEIFTITAIKKDYGEKVSLWLLVILMLHPISLWLAFEVRTYGLSSFLLLVCLVYGLRLTRNPQNIDYVKFGFVSLASLYSHYYAAIWLMFLYASILYILIYDKTFSKFGRKFLITTFIVAILFLPWIFVPLNTGREISNDWYVNREFVRFSIRYFTDPLQPDIFQSIFFVATGFSAAVFSFVVLTGIFSTKLFSHRLKRAFGVAFITFFLSYILLIVLSYAIRPMVTARYLKIFSLIWYFAGAIVISYLSNIKKTFLLVLIIGFSFTYLDMKAVFFDKEYKNAIEDINSFVPKNMTILALDNANLFCEYYLPDHKCILAVGEKGEILRKPSLLKNINLYYKEPRDIVLTLSLYGSGEGDCKKYNSIYRYGNTVTLCKISKDKATKLIKDSLDLRLNKYLGS